MSFDIEKVYHRIIILIQLSKYDLALISLQDILARNPNDAWAFILLGSVYYNKGEYDNAIIHIKKAISLNAVCPDYYRCYCTCLNAKGEYEEALKISDEGLMLDPMHIRLMYERAVALKALGKLERAEDLTKYLLNKDPNDDNNHRLLAKIYLEKRQLDDADSEFQKALALNPNNAVTYNDYAMMKVNSERNNEDESIEMLKESLRLNPENKAAQYNLEYLINNRRINFVINVIVILLCSIFLICCLLIFCGYIKNVPLSITIFLSLLVTTIWQYIENYLHSNKKSLSKPN